MMVLQLGNLSVGGMSFYIGVHHSVTNFTNSHNPFYFNNKLGI